VLSDNYGPDFGQAFDAVQGGQRPEMQPPLQNAAQAATSGPQLSPMAQTDITESNVFPAASQGTNPNINRYSGRLVSAETFEGDDGSILYRDPQTGKVKPTDSRTQVALRDPADGVVKIFTRSDETNEGKLVGAARVLAPGLAAGAVTARPGFAAAAAKALTPRASEIQSTSKPFYRAFSQEAGKINVPPDAASGIADRLRSALDRANLIPELAQPVYSAVKILDKGEPLTLDALQNIKRVIGRSFNSPDKNVRDAAAVASAELSKVIAEAAPNAARNLKTADAIHSTARSVQELQRKKAVAGLRAGRAGYGGNAVNSMRQVLSPIVQRAIEGKNTAFKPDEIQAMRDIVEGTTATNTLRGIGILSPSKGSGAMLNGVLGGGAAGVIAAGPVGLAGSVVLPALGAVANKLATVLTSKQIDRLTELVAKRSPAYKQGVTKAIQRYEKSQIGFVNDPSPNRLGAYISASRALSAGLTRDGIKVTSGDLLRVLPGSVQANAEDEQD
jgi:hypothetical protein